MTQIRPSDVSTYDATKWTVLAYVREGTPSNGPSGSKLVRSGFILLFIIFQEALAGNRIKAQQRGREKQYDISCQLVLG